MGYTHYWTKSRNFTDAEWLDIMKASAEIMSAAINKHSIPLAFEYDKPTEKPLVSTEVIRFNGIDEDGHETFYFDVCANDFEFCKTARKDYDAPVAAILNYVKHRVPEFSWRSDGWLSEQEHIDGLQLLKEATGVELEWANFDPADNDPDRDKVTNVVSLDHARDQAS